MGRTIGYVTGAVVFIGVYALCIYWWGSPWGWLAGWLPAAIIAWITAPIAMLVYGFVSGVLLLSGIIRPHPSDTEDFEDMAKESATAYTTIFSQIPRLLEQRYSSDADEQRRAIWLKMTVERLAESLKWRSHHTYSNEMDHVLGGQYRCEADRLLKLADRAQRVAHDRGIDGLSQYTAYSLAAFYLRAESLCFEYPHVIDIFQMESLGQKKILRDINGMLAEYDLEDVGRKIVL